MAAYNKAMEQLTQRYPNDFEAWAFYALTLQASAPKDRQDLRQSAKIRGHSRETIEAKSTASRSVALSYPRLRLSAACRQRDRSRAALCGIAPAAPHARHMPSHIYSMVGLWEESIASNRSALQVQTGLLPRDGLHDLRPPAARAGRQGQGACRESYKTAGTISGTRRSP